MADEVMVIEGLSEEKPKTRRGEPTMSSMLNGLKDDLMDTKAWMRGLKATAGGAAGRAVVNALFNHVPFVNAAWIKDESMNKLAKRGAKTAVGLLAGVLLERYIGEPAAYGLIGGVSGAEVTGLLQEQVVDRFLKDAAGKSMVNLSDISDGMDTLSPAERQFLNALPPEDLNEVQVESQNLLNEVAVEPASLYGIDDMARDAVLFS